MITSTHTPTKTQHTQGQNGYAHYTADKKEKSLVENTSNQTMFQTLL